MTEQDFNFVKEVSDYLQAKGEANEDLAGLFLNTVEATEEPLDEFEFNSIVSGSDEEIGSLLLSAAIRLPRFGDTILNVAYQYSEFLEEQKNIIKQN